MLSLPLVCHVLFSYEIYLNFVPLYFPSQNFWRCDHRKTFVRDYPLVHHLILVTCNWCVYCSDQLTWLSVCGTMTIRLEKKKKPFQRETFQRDDQLWTLFIVLLRYDSRPLHIHMMSSLFTWLQKVYSRLYYHVLLLLVPFLYVFLPFCSMIPVTKFKIECLREYLDQSFQWNKVFQLSSSQWV